MVDEPEEHPPAERAGEEPVAGDQPAAEQQTDEPAADVEPAAEAEQPTAEAEERAAEPEPAAESQDAAGEPQAEAGKEADAAAPHPAPEPAQDLSPKERRRSARSRHSGEARPQRSPEERHADRLASRREKATRRRARRIQERAKRTARPARAGSAADGAQGAALAPVHAQAEGKRKVRQGIVISDRAEKTIVVRIDVARRHRRYEKIVRSSNTLHAHDENNDAHEGDVVRVIESRPLSKTKRWRLVEVLERAR
jgi:small subunit ribosomal protein S17